MDTWLWRVLGWRLNRHLTVEQAQAALGDIAEDLPARERNAGYLRSRLWLMMQAFSVSRAYAARERQENRRSRRMFMGGSWRDDARLARRRLLKHPAATCVSVATLGIGIAAAAVAWSVVSAVVMQPVMAADPERLVSIGTRYPSDPDTPLYAAGRLNNGHLYPTFLAVRDSRTFESLSGSGQTRLPVGDRLTPLRGC